MPLINHYFPGAPLSPFNVMDLTVNWWLEYAGRAHAQLELDTKQSQEARRGK